MVSNRGPVSGLSMLNSMYRAQPNPYNPAGTPYDEQTQAAISDYSQQRGALYAASNNIKGDARTLALQFVQYCDQAANAWQSFDALIQNVQFQYRRPRAMSDILNPAQLYQNAMNGLENTRQIINNALEAAHALIPQITDAMYMQVCTDGLSTGNDNARPRFGTWGNVASVEDLDKNVAMFLQMLTSAAANKQQQAEQIAAACVDDLNAGYAFLNGQMDTALTALGVNLPSVHKAYAAAMRNAGKPVSGQVFIDLVEQGALPQVIDLATTVATRTMQLVTKEIKATTGQ